MSPKRRDRSGEEALFASDVVGLPVDDLAEAPEFQALEHGFQRQVIAEHGELFQGDSLEWLATLPDQSVNMVFADPPYNIGKADWDNFASQVEYVEWSMCWIEQAARILAPGGSVFICGFSEILADLKLPASRYFGSCRWLVWHYRNKANLGSDWGRSHESVLHFRQAKTQRLQNLDLLRVPYGAHTRKYPSHPQADSSSFSREGKKRDDWTPHPDGAKPKDVIEVPTTCNGMHEKTPHPTQKPEELVRKFVVSASARGDLVVDPFSGSGTTAVVSEQLGRRWLGCDLSAEYNSWAADRLRHVPIRSEEQWIQLDRANAKRRESIR